MRLSAHAFRLLLILLTLALLGVVGAALVRFGSTPTDENLFTQPPSGAMLTSTIEGRPVTDGTAGARDARALRPGDLITRAAGERVYQPDDLRDALQRAEPTVRVRVVRQVPGQRIDVDVDREALSRAGVTDVTRSAFVIDVTAGGASERAGMRVGDLIVRINGRPFRDVLEADTILRSGTVGHATDYEILRGDQRITLHVTLASFGLRLSLVVFSLAGMIYIFYGAWLGLARATIPAARFLGLFFVLVGAALGLLLLRRAIDTGFVVVARDVTLTLTVFYGIAVGLHASLYFPRTRPSLLARRWVLPVAYGLATASVLIALTVRNNVVPAGLTLVMVGYLLAMTWIGRADVTAETRRIHRILTTTILGVAAFVVLSIIGVLRFRQGQPPDPGLGGLALLVVPAVYTWVIGRYRLLELDLRLRRHVQYSVISTVWGLVPLCVLIWLVFALPHVPLPIPNVRFEGASIEIGQAPMDGGQRAVIEKIVLMTAAILLAFTLRRVAVRGQHWLASKFYRAEHDYRRAAKEVSKLVTARPDPEGLSSGLVDAVVKLVQVKRAGAIFFDEHQRYCPVKAHGFTEEQWSRVCRAADDVKEGVRRAVAEVDAEYVFPRLRRLLTDVKALYLFPLRSHDSLVGALVIGEKLAEDAFRDADFEFLGALASQVAPAVENAFLYNQLAQQERLKHELELARRIQMESLPQFTPSIEGLEIAGVSIPAFEVGGDYFDYLNGGPQRLTVMVGDVSGKGTSAALYMSKLQGIVRSLHVFDLSPHEFFVRTNDLLCRDLERRSFVTAIGGFFDVAQRQMVLARAGHLPLYHYCGATREVQRMLPRGLGFGLSNKSIFEQELEERLVPYAPGDVFLFITDGITESYGPSGDDFGEERVLALLARHAALSAREIRDTVTSAVRAFSGTEEQFDDQTVVVVKAV